MSSHLAFTPGICEDQDFDGVEMQVDTCENTYFVLIPQILSRGEIPGAHQPLCSPWSVRLLSPEPPFKLIFDLKPPILWSKWMCMGLRLLKSLSELYDNARSYCTDVNLSLEF